MKLCKESRVEKEKGLTYHSREQQESPEQGSGSWVILVLSSLLCSSFKVPLKSPFPGKHVPTAPPHLSTQIKSFLSCGRRGASRPCLLFTSGPITTLGEMQGLHNFLAVDDNGVK